jgi:hypothetical protein
MKSSFLAVPIAAATLTLLAAPTAMGAGSDRNGDGLPDRWERRHHLSLKVDQSKRDQDRDGLRNASEHRHGTNPRKADTDGDGMKDRDEIRTRHNPRDRDSDDDGRRDGDEHAGTVESFSDGVLTIRLLNGNTLSGKVDSTTEVECEDEADDHNRRGHTARAASDGDDDSSGGTSGGDDSSGRDPNKPHSDDDDNTADQGPDDENEARGDDDEGDDDDEDCGPAALVSGARVREAELVTSTGVFREVELLK